jgi:predicted transcriptional regulator
MATTSSPTTTVRLPRDLVEEVRKLAERHDRSLSAELRVALRGHIRDPYRYDQEGKS